MDILSTIGLIGGLVTIISIITWKKEFIAPGLLLLFFSWLLIVMIQDTEEEPNFSVKGRVLMFNEENEDECSIIELCNCCNGKVAFDNNEEVIFSTFCFGNPDSYYIGKYKQINNNTIVCNFKENFVSVARSTDGKKIVKVSAETGESFNLFMTNSECVNNLFYKFEYEGRIKYMYFQKEEYLHFVKDLDKKGVYSELQKIM